MISYCILQPPFLPPRALWPYLPIMGPIAWAIRFARLTWSLLVAWPLILLSALLDVVNLPSLLPSAAHRSGFDNWRIPFLGQIVWTITWGIPPEGGREYKVDDEGILHRLEAKAAPALSTLLFSGRDKSGAHLRSVPIVVPPAPEAACYGVVADGFGGQVVRGEVGATWLWREWAATESNGKETRSGTGDELAKADEKVLIYFVGGESCENIFDYAGSSDERLHSALLQAATSQARPFSAPSATPFSGPPLPTPACSPSRIASRPIETTPFRLLFKTRSLGGPTSSASVVSCLATSLSSATRPGAGSRGRWRRTSAYSKGSKASWT